MRDACWLAFGDADCFGLRDGVTYFALRITYDSVSIVTRTGDDGTTGLMYNRRVSKCHPRVEAYGAVDELNAALGLARATAEDDFVSENLLMIQKDLVLLMGELATMPADLQRYVKEGFRVVE